MAKIADMQEVSLSLLKPYERNAKIHGEAQIEKLMDSRLTELGEWDMDMVQFELKELDAMDFDVSLTGFELDKPESLSFDELDDTDDDNENVVVRLVFSSYKDYHFHENEVKEFATEIGCGMTVGK